MDDPLHSSFVKYAGYIRQGGFICFGVFLFFYYYTDHITELQTVPRIQQQLIRHSDNILRAECPVDAVRQSFPQRNQIKLNLFFPHRGPLKCIQYSSQQHTVQ